MIVTGIGTRDIDDVAFEQLAKLGEKLALRGWTLRSGGANGCDLAFELGWNRANSDKMEIYLPWSRFNKAELDEQHIVPSEDNPVCWSMAQSIIENIHPAWHRCDQWAKMLHGRNAYQVLGRKLVHPSDVLICMSRPDRYGNATRGTATAWNLAGLHGIPRFNLWHKPARYDLKEFLDHHE